MDAPFKSFFLSTYTPQIDKKVLLDLTFPGKSFKEKKKLHWHDLFPRGVQILSGPWRYLLSTGPKMHCMDSVFYV